MNNRESGYYWIRTSRGWEPAEFQFHMQVWLVLGSGEYYQVEDKRIYEIKEEPIPPPKD